MYIGANKRYNAALEEMRVAERKKESEDLMRKKRAIQVMEAKEEEKTAELNYLKAKRRRRELEETC